MSVPDFKYKVKTLYDLYNWNLRTKEGCGDFTRAAAAMLHKHDKGFGLLKKKAGQNHVVDSQGRLHAVDAVLYLPTGQAVDIISNSATEKAAPFWKEDIPRYDESHFLLPDGQEGPSLPPLPPSDDPSNPPPVDLTPLLEQIAAVKAAQEALDGKFLELVASADGIFGAMDARLVKLETQKLTLRASGNTGRVWGHAHPVNITLEEVK